MSSQKRIEANRRNAQKSTGPRTPAGKARSAQNATVHGYCSLHGNPLPPGAFLKIEDEAQFQLLLDEYIATYSPKQRDELDLLTEAVYAKWRQQRIWVAETNQIEIAIAQNEVEFRKNLPAANAHAHLANGMAKSGDMLKLYMRYEAQLHRQYLRCLKELRDLQDSRPPADETPNEATPETPTPEPATPNEPKTPELTPEEAAAEAKKPPSPATSPSTSASSNPKFDTIRHFPPPRPSLEIWRRAKQALRQIPDH